MDLNSDGVLDIVSGSYGGEITMYEGLSEGGFSSPSTVPQSIDTHDRKMFHEVMFSSTTFADFNNDGLLDAFVGGIKGVRVMLNEGTASEPHFGVRHPLMRTDSMQVSVFKEHKPTESATDFKAFVLFTDWDGDGVGDLISTSSYSYEGEHAVLFHKGVMVNGSHLFEPPQALWEQAEGTKTLPGSTLIPLITDYNADNKPDLLLGVSMLYDTQSKTLNPEEEAHFKYSNYKKSTSENKKTKGYIIFFKGI